MKVFVFSINKLKYINLKWGRMKFNSFYPKWEIKKKNWVAALRLKNQTKWSIYFGELGEMLLTAVLASISITRIIFDGGTVPLILIQIQYMPLGAFSRAIYHHYQALNMRDITIASNKSINFVLFFK